MAARKKTAARKSASRKPSSSKKRSGSSSPSSRGKDAIALLKADHTLVQGLFDQYEKTRADGRKGRLAEQICNELTVHAQIEEEIFYPAARGVIREEDLLDEATVEHQGAKDLIAQIQAGSPGDKLFDAKVKVLGEYIKHHVKEEQNEMFPQVRKTKLDLKALGEQLEARKMELKKGGGAAASRGRASSASQGAGSQGSKGTRGRSSSPKGGGRSKGGSQEKPQSGEEEGFVTRMARGMGLA